YDGTNSGTSYRHYTKPEGEVVYSVGATTREITGRSSEALPADFYEAVFHEEEVDVYDIVNAGPRHRFTADNLLVSNCYGMQWRKFKRFAKTDYKVDLTDYEAEHYY